MAVVFFAVIFVFATAKTVFGADEDTKSRVKEGHFRIKCEEMVSFLFKMWSWIYYKRTVNS